MLSLSTWRRTSLKNSSFSMASASSHSLAKPWQSKNEYLSFVFEIRSPLLKTTRLPR
ncbi:putative plasmid-related protein [Proteus mirabilis HI4320]|uniref:Plasmid-related protein n=1 Tax=Proteus mirabilis (strain HI4320) TaxID=529507 RepID=B4EWV3_PROMH|nr:putative plasmid-related protein [Proteus mirabilis HI4320]